MSMLLTALFVAAGSIPTYDPSVVEGNFDARLDRNPHITLSTMTESNGYSNWSAPVEASAIRSLRVSNGRVTFQLNRPAGSFTLNGKVSDSRVRGTFEFRPNPLYKKQLGNLGFNGLTSERLFVFAVANLSVGDIRYLNRATADDLSTVQLVRMINHGVDVRYVRGMWDTGLRHLGSEELIMANDRGVTPHYVKMLQRFGYYLPLRDYIRGKDSGVNERYVAELNALEHNLDFEELIRFNGHASPVQGVHDS